MEIKKITDPAFQQIWENPDRDRFYGVSRRDAEDAVSGQRDL